jgi:Flp pilus assembly protein TadG
VNARRFLRRAQRDTSGAAVVEFAMVTPLLLMLLLGIIEFGRIWNVRHAITDATREGARVAAVNNNRLTALAVQDSVRRTVQRRVITAALDTTKLTITWAQVGGQQPGTPATVTLEYNYQLLFPGRVRSGSTVTLRSSFVMRNE